ncbi:MAG: ribonuclease HII [Gammaproteobacteria bacterium RBG_16_66_13]|nr:MAG: ribonuclease HII [Gammaproteobacteria bacterium RBG_16_66_13]
MTGPRPARPHLTLERKLAASQVDLIAGLDEVGRGALAGPLVAAAVVLPIEQRGLRRTLAGVRDSKQLTDSQRRTWADRVRQIALDYGLGLTTPSEIDEIGPLAGTLLAMERALDALSRPPRHLLLDHVALPSVPVAQTSITHGDATVLSIAAASVLAKVWRDDLMLIYDRTYPAYGFAHHKGYGTLEHVAALGRLGPCPIHRLSFHPVVSLDAGETDTLESSGEQGDGLLA